MSKIDPLTMNDDVIINVDYSAISIKSDDKDSSKLKKLLSDPYF